MTDRVFLTADWRHLVMLHFEVPPEALLPRVPTGTRLDLFDGRAFVSIVGFHFERTRVWSVPALWLGRFGEVNLRFYVRRWTGDGWRRGVVFVKEISPARIAAVVARWLYGENYCRLPFRAEADLVAGQLRPSGRAAYAFRHAGRWHRFSARRAGPLAPPPPGSFEEFAVEHYYGYARRRGGGTLEYRVDHPPWRVAAVGDVEWNVDASSVYGESLGPHLAGPPIAAFVADGSAVRVMWGRHLACHAEIPRSIDKTV